ncbi:hypothetical protein FB451DRAFT_1216657 [Mycena latifolia]|nr:hypothetical protein FB451DRAFT_1216657 [Mycena latifolia]
MQDISLSVTFRSPRCHGPPCQTQRPSSSSHLDHDPQFSPLSSRTTMSARASNDYDDSSGTATSSWSRLPPELVLEIAAHNASSVPALCAMCLMSKTVRSCTIPFLFATVKFSSADDFDIWLDMFDRTPELGTNIVQEVKICPSGTSLPAGKALRNMDPSQMPHMPSVRRVLFEFERDPGFSGMAAGYLSMFPNMTELRLSAVFWDMDDVAKLLGACGSLKALWLARRIAHPEGDKLKLHPQSSRFDLTMLEELVVKEWFATFVLDLLRHSPPIALKSLAILLCQAPVNSQLLTLVAPSLHHLMLYPVHDMVVMFRRVRSLPELTSLTILVTSGRDPQAVIDAFPAAPNMKILSLRVEIYPGDENHLNTVMERTLRWDILAAGLPLRFPRFERLKFQFYVVRHTGSPLDDPSGFHEPHARARLEGKVRERIKDAGDYLSFEWLDEDQDRAVFWT